MSEAIISAVSPRTRPATYSCKALRLGGSSHQKASPVAGSTAAAATFFCMARARALGLALIPHNPRQRFIGDVQGKLLSEPALDALVTGKTGQVRQPRLLLAQCPDRWAYLSTLFTSNASTTPGSIPTIWTSLPSAETIVTYS